jgi:dTDP-glucose 4,6-dehydratase
LIIVTGGAGFIGSNFVLDWLAQEDEAVINIDKLTYAGHLENLKTVINDPRHIFVQEDINNRIVIDELLQKYQPTAIVHFAAESHVDRSITGPSEFIQTNIVGTFNLLEAARNYFNTIKNKSDFKFLHVSTDEVYGSLSETDPAFTETTSYSPNSPYSASKASSDHLVRAYFHTYGLPVLTTNCSNNYGPHQYGEKLIALMILNALEQKPLPIYGDGKNIRDWLYVSDHCSAIRAVLKTGKLGEVYNIGGNAEKNNLEVVQQICKLLDEIRPLQHNSYSNLISFVKDRPGHDRRYAINSTKIQKELGWSPQENFDSGLRKTIQWYIQKWNLKKMGVGA